MQNYKVLFSDIKYYVVCVLSEDENSACDLALKLLEENPVLYHLPAHDFVEIISIDELDD